jgi:porphobilinogen synthase
MLSSICGKNDNNNIENLDMSNFPEIRLRRLRRTEGLRKMFGQPLPGPEKFIWPVFVIAGSNKKIPIESMPGQFRYSIDTLISAIEPVAEMGIGGIMLFAVIDDKDKTPDGSSAYAGNGLVQKAILEIKKYYPDLTLFTDVCMCAYTTHGHCGVIDQTGTVLNDPSIEILAKIALSHAEAGADAVAPSAMMDGQICEIRNTLDNNSFSDTILMSYSTKYASSMYGPFRDAADSSPGHGDRKSYQLPYNDTKQAIRESEFDEFEGADILMVKPALFYLDIIAKLAETTTLPIAAYNVSGEYSMIHASAEKGYGELYPMARESIAAISRAGAGIILSYWANQLDKVL